MLSRSFVGRLRRVGAWTAGQKAHRLIAPTVCAAIHSMVLALGPRVLPDDLVLKHHYDYHPVQIDPGLVTGALRAGAGTRRGRETGDGLLARYRAWRNLGGGWKSANRHITRSLHGRFVADGDWDELGKPFEPLQGMVQLFTDGRKPAETTEYRNYVRRIRSREFTWTRGMATVEEVDAYFDQLIALYEDIRLRGYRTQTQLGNDGSDEIRVCIDRKGEVLVFGGGTHRLSIVLLLGLESVPVLVKRVHSRWADQCVRRYGGTVYTAIGQGIRDLEMAPGKP